MMDVDEQPMVESDGWEEPSSTGDSSASQQPAAANHTLRPPWWRRWLGGTQIYDEIMALTDTIERFPEAPANYVLRGEHYLNLQQLEAAEADFRRALQLIDEPIENNRWGVVAQSLRDRAQHGLTKITRKLGKSG
ncbi:MAG: hypothetical protein OHK0046_28720 [Anaerolineae bacterium]